MKGKAKVHTSKSGRKYVRSGKGWKPVSGATAKTSSRRVRRVRRRKKS